MVSTEHSRERRSSARKIFMTGLLVVIIAGGAYLFISSAGNDGTEDIASQQIEMPTITPSPLTSPPDQPLPTPTLPPVPLPDAMPRGTQTPAPATPIEPAPLQ